MANQPNGIEPQDLAARVALLEQVLRDTAEELTCAASRRGAQAGTVAGCDCWACDRADIIARTLRPGAPEEPDHAAMDQAEAARLDAIETEAEECSRCARVNCACGV